MTIGDDARPWSLMWYDRTDREGPCGEIARGVGLRSGLLSLWRAHLQDGITDTGLPSSSEFMLHLIKPEEHIAIDPPPTHAEGLVALRAWREDLVRLDLIVRTHLALRRPDRWLEAAREVVRLATGPGLELERRLEGVALPLHHGFELLSPDGRFRALATLTERPDGYACEEVLSLRLLETLSGATVGVADLRETDGRLVRFLGARRLLLQRESGAGWLEVCLAPFELRRLRIPPEDAG